MKLIVALSFCAVVAKSAAFDRFVKSKIRRRVQKNLAIENNFVT